MCLQMGTVADWQVRVWRIFNGENPFERLNFALHISVGVIYYLDFVFEKEIDFILFCKVKIGLPILKKYLKILDVFQFLVKYKFRIDVTAG